MTMVPVTVWTALAAVMLERWVGYPAALQRLIGHPVEWMGALLTRLEAVLNISADPPSMQKRKGIQALALFLGATAAVAIPVALLLRAVPYGWLVEAVVATAFLAQRDLARHVEKVAAALTQSVEAGREAVSHIVGRDPQALDRSDVARAAIESLAENASDAVVAPALALALFGLPGIVLYKAINTADSMIGHRSPRYVNFGWAAARLDDVANYIPARLTGLLFAIAGALTQPGSGGKAWQAMRQDAHKHASPNAGWPEAAMAGVLDVRLGGPRSYEGRTVDLPWMGTGRIPLDETDIRSALAIYWRGLNLLALLLAAAGAAAAPKPW